ncbi:hypothetical protein [Herbaspirillum sp. SJZ099]|uniref:hypothetical protein n=1 Tax=Herbaspirillum sp. SJZ099 TaxID=2572916 RepID=UPI0011AAF6E0|nr:hypothetical protein [Herbaspirillum sp. SJZ099]
MVFPFGGMLLRLSVWQRHRFVFIAQGGCLGKGAMRRRQREKRFDGIVASCQGWSLALLAAMKEAYPVFIRISRCENVISLIHFYG